MADIEELIEEIQENNPYEELGQIELDEIEPDEELFQDQQPENQMLGLEDEDLLNHDENAYDIVNEIDEDFENLEFEGYDNEPDDFFSSRYTTKSSDPELEKQKIFTDTPQNLLANAELQRKQIEEQKTVNNVLRQAKNSHIIAEDLEVQGSIGRHSKGSVLAVKNLNTAHKDLPGTVITAPESTTEGTTTFTGDWNHLDIFLQQEVPKGRFNFSNNFSSFTNPEIRDKVSSINVLDKELTILNTINDLEIQKTKPKSRDKIYDTFRGNENEFYALTDHQEFETIIKHSNQLRDLSQQKLPRAVQAVEQRPSRNFEKEGRLLSQLSKQYETHRINSDTEEKRKEKAQELYQNEKDLLYQMQEDFEAGDFLVEAAVVLETETPMNTEEFLNEFENGNSEKVIGEGFQASSTNEKYDEGVEKLESLARIEGNYQTEIDYEQVIQEVMQGHSDQIDIEQVEQKALQSDENFETILFGEELNQLIGQTMQENPEKGQELIDKRDELKTQIENEKRLQAFYNTINTEIEDADAREQLYNQVAQGSPDFTDLNPDQVTNMLDTLATEHLEDNNSAYHDAKELAQQIDQNETPDVEFEIYDKSLENMPYKRDRELPCTFPGSTHETAPTFLNYMLDPATQVGTIETEKGDGLALMKMVEHDNENFLYVHSVEADKGENIASNHETATQIQQHIEQYAQTVAQEDIELDGIMYSMDQHNNGTPVNFQETVKENENVNDYDIEELELNQLGTEHYGFDQPLEQGIEVYQKAI